MSSSSLLSIGKKYKKYNYQPLSYRKSQIRLLRVVAGFYGPVRCSVEIFDLDNAPAYAALSYMWGPELPVHDILIDGRALPIRRNLHHFLKCRRKDKKHPFGIRELYLFIDQICIDQSDPDERGRQVQLMSQIYSRSWYVIVWLNDEQGQCSSAARGLSRSSKKTSSLAKLLSNDYFTRLWIVQELLLAPCIWIYTPGNAWLPWANLVEIAREASSGLVTSGEIAAWELVPVNIRRLVAKTEDSARHRKFAPWKLTSPNKLSWFRFVSKAERRSEPEDILDILRFSANICHEPRDKVYGLMNLLKVEHQLIVDYNKPIYDVFKDVVLELHSVIEFEGDKTYTQWLEAMEQLGANMGISSDDVADLFALLEFMNLIVPPWIHKDEGSASFLPSFVSKIGVEVTNTSGLSTRSSEDETSPSQDSLEPWAVSRKEFDLFREVALYQEKREDNDPVLKEKRWHTFVQSIKYVASLREKGLHLLWYCRHNNKTYEYKTSPNWEYIFRISPFRMTRIMKEYEEERSSDEALRGPEQQIPRDVPVTSSSRASKGMKNEQKDRPRRRDRAVRKLGYYVYGWIAILVVLFVAIMIACGTVLVSLL